MIATKAGIHWDANGSRTFDASPNRLRNQCDESLQRLGTDYVDLLYLHAPDPIVPVTESAGALKSLLDKGKTRSVGVSNFNLDQLKAFHAVCPITAVQPPYNMLQREIETDIVPWCLQHVVGCQLDHSSAWDHSSAVRCEAGLPDRRVGNRNGLDA